MSQQLKPLLLPILAQERKRRESILEDIEVDYFSPKLATHMFATSETSTPVTPTFSARAHCGYPSSSSSLDSHCTSSFVGSPSSSYMGTKASKASLPDVQEEKYEREDPPDNFEYDSFDDNESIGFYYCLSDHNQCYHRDPVTVQNSTLSPSCVRLESHRDVEYDLTDSFHNDQDYCENTKFKKRGVSETPLSGLATRLGTKFPLFTRKWKIKTPENSISIPKPRKRTAAICSRSSSLSNSAQRGREPQSSPISSPSLTDDREDMSSHSKVDINKANSYDLVREEAACTPLLPPLMSDASANIRNISIRSPLQSPSVAEVNEPLVGTLAPLDLCASPPPPPPLLNIQPSTTSFSIPRSARFVSPLEPPPITIADPDDEWANKLGHANFTIFPEPYIPLTFDMVSCQQLRVDWDLARSNYTKHLVRTGEHYGVTSHVYRFTKDKWKSIDKTWKFNNELAISNMIRSGSVGNQGSFDEKDPTVNIPSLGDLCDGNKFPSLGDDDIISPMAQVTSTLRRNPTKKARVIKFFSSKLSFPK